MVSLQALAAQTGPVYSDVKPIFQQRCVLCHYGSSPVAGLSLDSLEGLQKGSARGKVVVAGSPDDSELVRRIRGESQPRMPMTGPPFLSDTEISSIEQWIAAGMPSGEKTEQEVPTVKSSPRPAAGEKVTYLHVAPIFASHCAKCHTEKGLMGPAPKGYRLTSYRDTLASRDRARVVPGNPAASELLRRIRGYSAPRMPLDGPPYLDDEEIQLIEDWIEQGAANAEAVTAPVPVGARVRFQGRLTERNHLDDLLIMIGAHTRIDKNPRPGDFVEVRGHIDRAGQLVVDRLRRRKK